jgi:hypothetical protein
MNDSHHSETEAGNDSDRKLELPIIIETLQKRRRIREAISGELQDIVTHVEGMKNSSRTPMIGTDLLIGMVLLMARGAD